MWVGLDGWRDGIESGELVARGGIDVAFGHVIGSSAAPDWGWRSNVLEMQV